MDVAPNYKPPVQEPKPKRGFIDFFLGVFKFLGIPFWFLRDKLKIIREDTQKKHNFHIWRAKQNQRYRRGNRINDEF